MKFQILIMSLLFFLFAQICFTQEDILISLSDKIGTTPNQVSYCSKSTKCKKLFLIEQKVEFIPDFYERLKEEFLRLGYEFVNDKKEADCTVGVYAFGFDKNLPYPESVAIDAKSFPYFCWLSITIRDKSGLEKGFMSFCGVRIKDKIIKDNRKYITAVLRKIYPYLLKALFPYPHQIKSQGVIHKWEEQPVIILKRDSLLK